ncbi:MAG: pyridoxal phosphate-dependent aminotransferase [Bacteriovoracaceae bacterium]|nr:pyridoxal phosphate-dependent aminotransferase [Bacteriovoracaceae bacterium]
MLELSKRVQELKESETLAMGKKAQSLKEQGVAVINLSIGEPDFFIPDFIKEAGRAAIDQNFNFYSPVAGFKDLREAICEKLKRDNQLDYTFSQIVVSTGAKQSVANILIALLNPGDEVIIPAPYWVSYKDMVEFFGGVARIIPASIENNYKISKDTLVSFLKQYPKAKAFLYSNPSNPSGCTYHKEELSEFAKVFEAYPDMTIISDEIYEYIHFSDKQLVSIASFPNMKDRTVVINGVSKAFSMTGWRVGYMAAPKLLADACDKIQSQFTSGTNSVAQKAVIAALLGGKSKVEYMSEKFLKRRNHLLKELESVPNLKSHRPEGAFYVLPSFAAYEGMRTIEGKILKDARDLSMYLLEVAHVALTPGEAFGAPWCLRFSYAIDESRLTAAVTQIKDALKALVKS